MENFLVLSGLWSLVKDGSFGGGGLRSKAWSESKILYMHRGSEERDFLSSS